MSNELVVGEARVGRFYVDRSGLLDEGVPCMLIDDGQQIRLKAPLDHGQISSQLGRWFNSRMMTFGDDPDRTRFDYNPPETVAFQDYEGVVVLVGCRWVGTALSGDAAEGRIVAKRAVVGARTLRYPMVNRMKCEISGLNDWAGMQGLERRVERGEDGRAESLSVVTSVDSEVILSRRLNLVASGTWRTQEATDGITIEAPLELETSASRPRDWDEHYDLQRAVLELMEISAWRAIGIRTMSVLRTDDPERVLSGAAVGPKWCGVRSYERPFGDRSEGKRSEFLFGFTDIGPRGISRWLRVRKEFARGITQMHASLRQPGMYLEVQQVNAGSALEAIGYVLARESGKSERGAANEKYTAKLERIRDSIPEDVIGPTWVERSKAAFMAAKHVDADAPPFDDQMRALGENILAFRYWLGKRLGASDKALKHLLSLDPVVRRFRLR